MGSVCSLKVRAISDEMFIMSITDSRNVIQELDCTKGAVHEIHFHIGNEYSISFSPEVKSPFGYLTVSSVSDFCWMVLNLVSYFSESLEIVEARPDPVFMIRCAAAP